MFQDNKEDVKFLLSKEGKEKIVKLHIDAILKYMKE
jgi:N-acetylmuramoyl-L-alanine amidase